MRVVGAQGGRRMTLLSGAAKPSSSPIAQVIPGCLYFTSLAALPKADSKTLYMNINDEELVHYDAFYDDFGPLNLAVLYRFCQFLNDLIQSNGSPPRKRIFLYTDMDPKNRVNAVYLIASYMIIYHNLTAEQAYLRLQSAEPPQFIGFRDAALGPPSYLLHVQHVIKAIEKALKFSWLDFAHFDPDEYEYFERVENGDLNWIVPGKMLSFCGPHDRSYIENGYPYHSPEVYFDYFRTHNVTTIVRLNKKIYNAKRFTEAGFDHHDLFFIDGSTPSDEIVLRFIDIVEQARGAVAVHCKAGLGRTGCMIACWMMKNFRMTAPQCMGWLRVCRPGSVIGPQQQFLIDKQAWCWRLGTADGLAAVPPEEPPQQNGVVEAGGKKIRKEQDETVVMNGDSGKAKAKKAMEQETALNTAGQSQGDRLCEIKARVQARQHSMRTGSSSTSPRSPEGGGAPSPPFVFPETSPSIATQTMPETPKVAVQPQPSCNFSSATTPIKQLRLTVQGAAGQAPAFISRNPPQQQQQQHHRIVAQHSVSNKIPIQKVYVSSTLSSASSPFPSRVQLHRKHFSASRLKPYHPVAAEGHSLAQQSPYNAHNHRYLELAGLATPTTSTTSPAAQSYGKQLAKQYKHQQRQHTSTGASAATWPQSPTTDNHQSNHNGSCKYELRPRDQLHLPLRFTSEAPSSPSTTTTQSPFALTRHQKTSKSATAFFPPSRL